ncbi:MAG: CRISPR-associated endonuclease Cas2, partial [Verrucomicrobia bacterium]|nr:CRISPR-associated endonuclease Cas2 [Verrucomicrobiota bacterium]
MSDRNVIVSSRHTYLVCYDIANDRRLKKVFKVCKNHGTHLQFSVFECDLNPRELVQLQ